MAAVRSSMPTPMTRVLEHQADEAALPLPLEVVLIDDRLGPQAESGGCFGRPHRDALQVRVPGENHNDSTPRRRLCRPRRAVPVRRDDVGRAGFLERLHRACSGRRRGTRSGPPTRRPGAPPPRRRAACHRTFVAPAFFHISTATSPVPRVRRPAGNDDGRSRASRKFEGPRQDPSARRRRRPRRDGPGALGLRRRSGRRQPRGQQHDRGSARHGYLLAKLTIRPPVPSARKIIDCTRVRYWMVRTRTPDPQKATPTSSTSRRRRA